MTREEPLATPTSAAPRSDRAPALQPHVAHRWRTTHCERPIPVPTQGSNVADLHVRGLDRRQPDSLLCRVSHDAVFKQNRRGPHLTALDRLWKDWVAAEMEVCAPRHRRHRPRGEAHAAKKLVTNERRAAEAQQASRFAGARPSLACAVSAAAPVQEAEFAFAACTSRVAVPIQMAQLRLEQQPERMAAAQRQCVPPLPQKLLQWRHRPGDRLQLPDAPVTVAVAAAGSHDDAAVEVLLGDR